MVTILTRKTVPITGRVNSFLVFLDFSKQIVRRGGHNTQNYQFSQGYNILNRLQVNHLTLTSIIHVLKNIDHELLSASHIILYVYLTSFTLSPA